MKLGGICRVTENVMALKTFYEKILGQSAQGQGDYVYFDLGIHLSICALSIEQRIAPDYAPAFSGGSSILEILTEDVVGIYQRCLDLNCVIKPLKQEDWGALSFWMVDPQGQVISFIQGE